MLTGKNLSEISSTYTIEILLVTIIFFTTDKAPHFFAVRCKSNVKNFDSVCCISSGIPDLDFQKGVKTDLFRYNCALPKLQLTIEASIY